MTRAVPLLMACGLDIGSNTFSCTELVSRGGRLLVERDLSLVVRLSEGLREGGALSRAAVSRGLEALEEIERRFRFEGKPLRAVGTAALRMARDPGVFTGPAAEILGVEVEILSGEEEARLTARGAVLDLRDDGPFVVVDVGGQSTEISWTDPGGAWRAVSMPFGVVSLTAGFLASDPPAAHELEALAAEVRRVLEERVPRDISGTLVAVAGTATTLGRLELGLDRWQRERVHGLVVSRRGARAWLDRMCAVSAAERTARYGVRAGRADVFPAGLCVGLELLAHLGREDFVVSANGLRVGAALTLMEGAR